MGERSLFDRELADLAQERMLRRKRLRANVVGDGTFNEAAYTMLIAAEVERAKATYEKLKGGPVQTT